MVCSLARFTWGTSDGIFRFGSLVWDLSLGSFNWELQLGKLSLGDFRWEPPAWDPRLGGRGGGISWPLPGESVGRIILAALKKLNKKSPDKPVK